MEAKWCQVLRLTKGSQSSATQMLQSTGRAAMCQHQKHNIPVWLSQEWLFPAVELFNVPYSSLCEDGRRWELHAHIIHSFIHSFTGWVWPMYRLWRTVLLMRIARGMTVCQPFMMPHAHKLLKGVLQFWTHTVFVCSHCASTRNKDHVSLELKGLGSVAQQSAPESNQCKSTQHEWNYRVQKYKIWFIHVQHLSSSGNFAGKHPTGLI